MTLEQSLRGDPAKLAFLEKHYINCIWHTMLLPGFTKRCCCKTENITTVCFGFSYKSKKRHSEGKPFAEGFFHAGAGCGKKLCDFAGIIIPPLVNPLQHNGVRKNAQAGHNERVEENRHPLNREAMEVISLIFCLWGGPQPGPLQYYYS